MQAPLGFGRGLQRPRPKARRRARAPWALLTGREKPRKLSSDKATADVRALPGRAAQPAAGAGQPHRAAAYSATARLLLLSSMCFTFICCFGNTSAAAQPVPACCKQSDAWRRCRLGGDGVAGCSLMSQQCARQSAIGSRPSHTFLYSISNRVASVCSDRAPVKLNIVSLVQDTWRQARCEGS